MLCRSGLFVWSWCRRLYIGGALSLRVFASELVKAALTVISIVLTDARLYLSHTVYTHFLCPVLHLVFQPGLKTKDLILMDRMLWTDRRLQEFYYTFTGLSGIFGF